MKSALKEKFQNNVLVKPLYRKLKNGNKIKPKLLVSVDSTYNLDGGEIYVRKNVNLDNSTYGILRGKKVSRKLVRNGLRKTHKMISALENKKTSSEVEGIEDKTNKFVQADNKSEVNHRVANTWLRLYPLPKLPGESVGSVVFRCILCQLGLLTLLVLWTVIWVFVIQSFEGPYEVKVSLDFEKNQNQLVIDLATELRQITPLSPKWKNAIEQRIQDERHLTMQAVSGGARVHPGQFWGLSGTFLFTVYVMTALGFGAPVPQTFWGRTSALIYAIIAVPTHVYLMLNASMCLVVNMGPYINQLKCSLRKRSFVLWRSTLHNSAGSPNCSRSSEVLKAPKRSGIGKKIMERLLAVLGACHSMPQIALLYYVCGAIAFGLARGNTSLDIAMFPLEFTTSGGLDRVNNHVRIIYGFYVEGAMMLLACGLATLRRHNGEAVNRMAEKYRLFATEG